MKRKITISYWFREKVHKKDVYELQEQAKQKIKFYMAKGHVQGELLEEVNGNLYSGWVTIKYQ